MSSTQYVTTAIVYPNSRIHVGWAWECLGADWLVRAHRAFGRSTHFVTGMDEHSINVERAAKAQGLTPQAYCDQMAIDIERVLRQMGISHDRFIRTSDADHIRVVQHLVERVYRQGDIYKARYEGMYCESCEAFYTDKDLVDGKCPSHGTTPKQISEDNYFFRLSKYEKPLLELFERRPDFLQPEPRRAEILNFIKAGLKDFSISRSTFTWGVPLPFEPAHVVYVWFDALINYLTAAGIESTWTDPGGAEAQKFAERWPASVHVIGKDIARFHCVYWPAMLLAMGIELPKRVFAHGFITLKGARMSKSSGNRVTPDEVMSVTGPDPFRYYLLAENQFAQDGNFDIEALVAKANSDLANDFGNLVNRTISMSRKYFEGQALQARSEGFLVAASPAVHASFAALREELEQSITRIDPQAYAQACQARSRVLNLYIDQTKPWALAKSGATAELTEVLGMLLEGVRWIASCYLPILPFGMPRVFEQLGIRSPVEGSACVRDLRWGEAPIAPQVPTPIYPRIELAGALETPSSA